MTSLREAIQQVYEKHGRLTPKLVVEEARDPESPLHDRVFDVDVEEAAERYYLDRAHELIRTVKVKFRQPDSDIVVEIRQWHAISTPQGSVYEPAEKIAADPFTRQLLLREMERDWRDLKARYESFNEFSQLVLGDLAETGS